MYISVDYILLSSNSPLLDISQLPTVKPASSALAFDALNDDSSNMVAVRLTEPKREKVQIALFLKNQSANFVNDLALWEISFFTAPIDAKVVPSISVIGS